MADKRTGKKPKKERGEMTVVGAGQKGGEASGGKKEAEQRKKK